MCFICKSTFFFVTLRPNLHYFAKVCHFGSINDFWRRICKVRIENYKYI